MVDVGRPLGRECGPRLLGAGGDLGQVVARKRSQRVGQLQRPRPRDGRGGELGAGRLALGDGLLAEQEVGDVALLGGGWALDVGAQRGGARVGAHADGLGRDAEQPGQVLVGASLLEDELQHGALVGRQGVQAHRGVRVVIRPPRRRGAARQLSSAVMAMPTAVPYERSFDALYGLEIVEHSDELVRARVPVRDEIKQPMGLVHGGVFASMAESIASLATFAAVHDEGMIAVGLSNQTSFLRPITQGTVHATARRRHRGRTTWVWEVDITDDEDRLCALVRMTIAVRPARA